MSKRINPFTLTMPGFIIPVTELSPGAKILYSFLAYHVDEDTGTSEYDEKELTQDLGMTLEQLHGCMKELVNHHLVISLHMKAGKKQRLAFNRHPWMNGYVF